MLVKEKQQSYGNVIAIMTHPKYYQCVMKANVGKPDVDCYGMAGFIQVEVEWEVNDLMLFAEIRKEISLSEEWKTQIVSLENKLSFGKRC